MRRRELEWITHPSLYLSAVPAQAGRTFTDYTLPA